jgi:hypothetical protein
MVCEKQGQWAKTEKPVAKRVIFEIFLRYGRRDGNFRQDVAGCSREPLV